MNKTKLWLLPFFAGAMASCQPSQSEKVVFENTTEHMRVDEGVVMMRNTVESVWGTIPEGQLPLLITTNGDTLPVQTDDLDGDGVWDEMFTLLTIPPQQSVTASLAWVEPAFVPKTPTRTNIRMAAISADGQYNEVTSAARVPAEAGTAAGVFQMEGPGWENDKVGFRNYFDTRNGMDIFGKITPEMVLDSAGINEDYHLLQTWGHDILMVGASLGSGALAVEKDSVLYRAATGAQGTYEMVSEGPLRSILRLHFTGWSVDSLQLNLTHEISIEAGTWYYTSKVRFPGNVQPIALMTGITTMSLDSLKQYNEFSESGIRVIATHGQQAYAGENLGMAVLLPEDKFAGSNRLSALAEGINNSVLVKMPVEGDMSNSFRYYACWELSDERFANETFFTEFLTKEAAKMASPIVIGFQ